MNAEELILQEVELTTFNFFVAKQKANDAIERYDRDLAAGGEFDCSYFNDIYGVGHARRAKEDALFLAEMRGLGVVAAEKAGIQRYEMGLPTRR